MKNNPKMLILDDNEDVLSALSDYYREKNFTVASASNGEEGFKLLEAEKMGFDIVLTDLIMPNISGVGVIAFVKKNRADTVVIAMTGWGDHPAALASEAKADWILRKPIKLDELDAIIAELLAQ